jgi:hypothetical protein
MTNQLLCTFSNNENLDSILELIQNNYSILLMNKTKQQEKQQQLHNKEMIYHNVYNNTILV